MCSSDLDLVTKPNEVIKRILGVDEHSKVTSGVNYQKLSLREDACIASIEFDTKIYFLDEVKKVIQDSKAKVGISMRCEELGVSANSEYFETMASFAINKAIESKEDLLYIDCFEDSYKVIKLTII